MPIHPDQRARYPADWPAISYRVRAAAGFRCQRCHVENGAWGWRDSTRAFHPIDRAAVQAEYGLTLRPPFTMRASDDLVRVIRIVLTVAHLDHQPEHNADENLEALCQRCHLGHDRFYHRLVRARRRHEAMDTLELPLSVPHDRKRTAVTLTRKAWT